MDGLEAVEIPISTCKNIIDFRIDANTYKKEFLASDRLLMKMKTQTIENISTSIQNFGAYSLCNFINFQDSGIPFLMTKNIKENFIDWNIEKYVDEKSHEMLWKSHCHRGQVLVTMAGEYLGRVAVYNSDSVASSNQAIAKISLKDGQNPYCVSTFLNSKYGQHQIQRFRTITGQPNINMSLISSLRVPEFSQQFCEHIESIMKRVDDVKQRAFDIYSEAEKILLEELGVNDFTPSDESVAIKSFSESFSSSGRLDSEYYQPKYDDIIGRVKGYKGGYKKLGAITTLKKSIEPGSDAYGDEGVGFLRVADLFKFELREPEIKLSESLFDPQTLDDLKPKKGEVLLSKDGSVGIAYTVRENANFIPSGAIVRLQQISDILPDVLALILNSQIVQLQAERDAGGSIIQHWKPSEINEVLLPMIDVNVQKIITEKVAESFTLRAESKRLLEEAKAAVERAIEEGEIL